MRNRKSLNLPAAPLHMAGTLWRHPHTCALVPRSSKELQYHSMIWDRNNRRSVLFMHLCTKSTYLSQWSDRIRFFLSAPTSDRPSVPSSPLCNRRHKFISLGWSFRNVKMATHVHPVRNFRKKGVAALLRETSSWRGAYICTRTILFFICLCSM
jgi:hypothetical protein